MDFLLLFFATVACLFMSIPLHEISHWVCLKAVGCRSELQIKFFYVRMRFENGCLGFDLGGWVRGADDQFIFPSHFRENYRVLAFFIGLSGGLGAAILMLPFLLLPLPHGPLLVVISFQLFKAVQEGTQVYNAIRLGADCSKTTLQLPPP